MRGTKLGDTAVKQNLCASLSPGCQGRTSGMLPGDKGRLAAWFLHMLTFVSFHVLYGNSWHWGWFGYHKGPRRSSFRHYTQRMLLKHMWDFCLNLTNWRKWLDNSINSLYLKGHFLFNYGTFKKSIQHLCCHLVNNLSFAFHNCCRVRVRQPFSAAFYPPRVTINIASAKVRGNNTIYERGDCFECHPDH